MVLGGLWHGARWSFVVWGALHGSYLMVHRKRPANPHHHPWQQRKVGVRGTLTLDKLPPALLALPATLLPVRHNRAAVPQAQTAFPLASGLLPSRRLCPDLG